LSDVDALATQLVQQAPDLHADTLAALRTELERIGTPLALSINRIVELIEEHLVDIAIALPPIAEACSVLVTTSDARVLDAMKYQIDTLQPVPDKPPSIAAPDVPLSSLKKRPSS
jgi:hypothetical protein